MKNIFIDTHNVNRCNEICVEMEDPASTIGPSLAMFTGPAGRGKTEFAKHYATNTNAIYIPPMNIRTPAMVLREIVFELCELKPHSIDSCLTKIQDEMTRERRIIFIDEADLLAISILEMLRNVNERYACSIIFIGEEGLKTKVASRRRIMSRIRRRIEFKPVVQADLALFYKKALGQEITAEVTAILHHACGGDWRPVLTSAITIERALKASDMKKITEEFAKEVTNGQR